MFDTFSVKLVKNIATYKNFYYGWVILLFSALSVFFSAPGQTYFASAFIESYVLEFGWSRVTISSIYSIATLAAGFLLFLVGKQIDRFGQKKVMIVVAAFLGLNCLWTSFTMQIWMLFIGFFFGRLLGQGSMTLLPSTLIPHWFIKRRALAFSLMSLGGVIGSAILPPLNTWLIQLLGWRTVWRFWTGALWLIFIPFVLIFIFNNPRDLGLSTDSETKKAPAKDTSAVKYIKIPSWTLKEASRTFPFWGMIYSQLLLPMVVTGIVFHFISIMREKGFSSSNAASILSLLAMVSFPTTLLAGWILDKIKIHYAAMIISAVMAVGLLVLLLFPGFAATIIFIVLLGSAMGLQSVWGGLVWPNYFGTRHLGSIRSMAMTASVIGSALGPIPFGISFDSTGKYNSAIMLMILFCVIGIAFAYFSPKPIRQTEYKNNVQSID